MGMPWIKLYTDFLDDPKLGFLSDAAQLLFVKMLLLAGECDAEGYLVNGDEPLTLQQVAWRLRVNPATMKDPLAELEDAGLIEDDDGIFLVTNFQKRQGRSQSAKREMWRERKRRQRDNENVTGESRVTDAGVTPLEGEGEQNRAEEEERESRDPPPPARPRKHDDPPTPACDVFEELTTNTVPGAWQLKVEKAVSDVGGLDLWRDVVTGWVGKGYNPRNVQGMLDCFQHNRIPGEATGPPRDNGKTPAELAREAVLAEEAARGNT